MINIPCKEDQHNEKLKYYCFNNLCTESRLGCQQCINTGKHKDHQVFEISQLDELRKVYQGKCQHIIDNLFILKSQLIEIIDEQIKNLQEKFQQRQNNFFTYEQIDSYMQDFLIFNQHKDDVIVSLKQVKNDIQIAVNQLKVKESSQQGYQYFISLETQQQFQRDFYSFINDSTQNQDIIQAQTQDLEITNQLVMKGKLLLSQTKNYEAYNTFDRVRKIDPMNKDALNGLGDCLRERSKYDDALQYYEATLELDQNNKQALIGKALCLGKLKKFQDARPIFERILNQDKNDIDAIWGLANLLRLQGKDEEAIKQYNKALQLNSNHLDSISGLGDCYRLLEKFDDAMKYLKKALQINPRHALSLVRMGDCLRLQKKFLEAVNFYSEALAIDPNDDWCKSKLSKVLSYFKMNVEQRVKQECDFLGYQVYQQAQIIRHIGTYFLLAIFPLIHQPINISIRFIIYPFLCQYHSFQNPNSIALRPYQILCSSLKSNTIEQQQIFHKTIFIFLYMIIDPLYLSTYPTHLIYLQSLESFESISDFLSHLSCIFHFIIIIQILVKIQLKGNSIIYFFFNPFLHKIDYLFIFYAQQHLIKNLLINIQFDKYQFQQNFLQILKNGLFIQQQLDPFYLE